jgi:hypothetical protein
VSACLGCWELRCASLLVVRCLLCSCATRLLAAHKLVLGTAGPPLHRWRKECGLRVGSSKLFRVRPMDFGRRMDKLRCSSLAAGRTSSCNSKNYSWKKNISEWPWLQCNQSRALRDRPLQNAVFAIPDVLPFRFSGREKGPPSRPRTAVSPFEERGLMALFRGSLRKGEERRGEFQSALGMRSPRSTAV